LIGQVFQVVAPPLGNPGGVFDFPDAFFRLFRQFVACSGDVLGFSGRFSVFDDPINAVCMGILTIKGEFVQYKKAQDKKTSKAKGQAQLHVQGSG
jgi:hypothetical protein